MGIEAKRFLGFFATSGCWQQWQSAIQCLQLRQTPTDSLRLLTDMDSLRIPVWSHCLPLRLSIQTVFIYTVATPTESLSTVPEREGKENRKTQKNQKNSKENQKKFGPKQKNRKNTAFFLFFRFSLYFFCFSLRVFLVFLVFPVFPPSVSGTCARRSLWTVQL